MTDAVVCRKKSFGEKLAVAKKIRKSTDDGGKHKFHRRSHEQKRVCSHVAGNLSGKCITASVLLTVRIALHNHQSTPAVRKLFCRRPSRTAVYCLPFLLNRPVEYIVESFARFRTRNPFPLVTAYAKSLDLIVWNVQCAPCDAR